MTPPKEETSQEKFKREKKREGWDPGEPRHASDPEEPAGLKDSVTGRHVAQNSLQESDPETSASLPPVPDTSPPSGPAEACHMASLKRHSSSSLPPEDGPTSVKQRNVSTDHSHSGIKNIPSPDQLEDAVKWKFLPDICSSQKNIESIMINESSILQFILNIIIKKKIALSNTENMQLSNEKVVYVPEFLTMFKKSKVKDLVTEKNRQYAFAFMKRIDNSCFKEIGPFYPVKYHSEDFICKEIKNMIQTKEIDNFSEIWIYTVNSPCIGRKNHIPCMYNLISLSFTLGQNYGIKMYIGFTKFYVFCTNMSNIFNNSKELDVNSKKIIEASDLNQLKFSVQFNISEFKHEFKKFMMNIPKNKRKVVYGNRMFPQSLDLALIYEEWKQEGIQTAEQLASEMSVKIGESASEMMPIFDKLKPVIINWWDKNVNRSMLLNERFSDFIEKNVVLHYLEDIQHREHHPELFQIDCYCLANEE